MKKNPDFLLREIAGESILIATGKQAQNFNGLITLNELGTFIFNNIENGSCKEDIVKKVLEAYDIDYDTANKDTDEFLKLLQEKEIVTLD